MQDLVMNLMLFVVGVIVSGAFAFLILQIQVRTQKNWTSEQFTGLLFLINWVQLFIILLFWQSKW